MKLNESENERWIIYQWLMLIMMGFSKSIADICTEKLAYSSGCCPQYIRILLCVDFDSMLIQNVIFFLYNFWCSDL